MGDALGGAAMSDDPPGPLAVPPATDPAPDGAADRARRTDRGDAAASETDGAVQRRPARRDHDAAAVSEALQRIERLLAEVRAHLDATARESRVREFSLARLIGALLQALVVGLVVWALSDWVFAIEPLPLLVKLAFAAVLQLVVITTLLTARDGD